MPRIAPIAVIAAWAAKAAPFSLESSRRILPTALLVYLLAGCVPTRTQEGIHLDEIRMSPGFSMALYARVPGARSMELSLSGVLYGGTRDEGRVYAVRDRNRGHTADEVLTIAEGLRSPNGVAFRDGALYRGHDVP